MKQEIPESWTSPPEILTSPENEVHLWRVSLAIPTEELARIGELLASDEVERAARFRFKNDRDQFVARRGLLRVILGRYMGLPPEKVDFTYNTFGKPELADNPEGLRFNLSHSSGLVIIAVARKWEIGIDVERIRKDIEIEQVSESLFSEIERETLRSLTPKSRNRAFFICWTSKEAYIKARGEGLSFPLNQFTVSFLPGEKHHLLEESVDAAEIDRWRLYRLAPSPGYVVALVVEGKRHRLRLWCGEGLLRNQYYR
jgi:4'-phosphopantetheinyl transferase